MKTNRYRNARVWMKGWPATLAGAAMLLAGAAAGAAGENAMKGIDAVLGGAGGVYLLVEPGELVIEVEKRDLNRRSTRTELRALLAGPDRQVLQEATIPDDGKPAGSGPGPVQRARLATRVERKGVYALSITVSNDRYGDEAVWGFRTNCPRFLVETSRGHRDRRHEEPIVLLDAEKPGEVCFLPRRGEFGIEVAGVPKDVPALPLYDGKGALVQTLSVNEKGEASAKLPAGVHREAVPWRLHLPRRKAVVQIDGVTRWEKDDLYSDLPCWTPEPTSWFPFLEHRWLLTPYRRNVYGQPGRQGEVDFFLHNSLTREMTVRLAIEHPGAPWAARLSAERVVVPPREGAQVKVAYTVPADGETRTVHVRATPAGDDGFSTYTTLSVTGGAAPASRPLTLPLLMKPWAHEHEQLGYLPGYPTESQVYFGSGNRPFIRTGGGIARLQKGRWVTSVFTEAVKRRDPVLEGASFGTPSTKVTFDRDGDLYLVATAGAHAAVLHSADGGESFAAYALPDREGRGRSFDIEEFTGRNEPAGPPPVLRYTTTAADPKLIWRRINDLELFLPRKENGRLVVGEPILISKLCIGLSAHSGIPASVVSRGSKVHVAWAEATDPAVKVPGVPTYVVTYDRETGKLGTPALVGYGPPPNDVHNSPSITIDGEGYLHVLVGTHGRPFPYTRSLKPNDAHSGWTEPALMGENLSQTYIGMACGPDGTLHTTFRLWRSGMDPFPASSYATLAYMRKRPGQPWESPKILVVPPFSEYSVFYHRLTIDRLGRLFLSYDCWSTFWFYRMDRSRRPRSLMMSPDGGDTWKLAGDADLAPAGTAG